MLELGKIQELMLVKKTEHGAFLAEDKDAGEEERVLLPKKYVPEGLSYGDPVEVFIYKDSSDRLIATTLKPSITLGQTAVLKVKQTGNIGAFVDSGLEKDFLLPFAEQTKRVREGEECLVALYIDKSDRLCVTMKVYDYLKTDSPYNKEDDVRGRVYELSRNFGAFVAVDDEYSALIPARELFKDLEVNSFVRARVTEVREDGKLTLSIRQKAYLQMDEDAERLMELIDSYDGVLPFSDKASPETIRREADMSKKEFKRAVGRLYKEHRIELGEGFIRAVRQS
ncbi:MAG TPA: RNA-binding protein [Lachnospiraceae bacterium]|nr:RNA-binding protein [Lachnospiraceae bacterium]